MKTLARMFTLIISFQMMIGCDSIALKNALQDVSLSENIEISGSISSVFKKVSNILISSAVAQDAARVNNLQRSVAVAPVMLQAAAPEMLQAAAPDALVVNDFQKSVAVMEQPIAVGCCRMCRCAAPTIEQGTLKVMDISDISNPVELYSERIVGSEYNIVLSRAQVQDADLKLEYISDLSSDNSRELIVDTSSVQEKMSQNMDQAKTVKARLITEIRKNYKSDAYIDIKRAIDQDMKIANLDLQELGSDFQLQQAVISNNAEVITLIADHLFDKKEGIDSSLATRVKIDEILNPVSMVREETFELSIKSAYRR